MKRIIVILGLFAVLSMSATLGNKLVLVEDSCKKCKITETIYKCGLCGTGMSITQEWGDETLKWMKCTFKCKNTNCNHTCTYKYDV